MKDLGINSKNKCSEETDGVTNSYIKKRTKFFTSPTRFYEINIQRVANKKVNLLQQITTLTLTVIELL